MAPAVYMVRPVDLWRAAPQDFSSLRRGVGCSGRRGGRWLTKDQPAFAAMVKLSQGGFVWRLGRQLGATLRTHDRTGRRWMIQPIGVSTLAHGILN